MEPLSGLTCYQDLKKLDINELDGLCKDIREQILSVISNNGGHLSSNLGIVETTVALHYVFDLPTDKLIFDVGHQCYAHKILSDRKDRFSKIRTRGGISGFPDSEESEFDAFTSGHAGTSISASLGYLSARDALEQDYCVINVVGDGSIVNGLNLEALTATNSKPKNFVVILNDNGMSISKNKNGLYGYISKRTMSKGYINTKLALSKIFGNSFVTRGLMAIRNFIKRIIGRENWFESFGFKYVGVVDGNDVKRLVKTLKRVKNVAKHKAVLLHLRTTKGKGYLEAENHADVYHGVGKNLSCSSTGFGEHLGDKLCELAKTDKKIVAICAGMKDGTGLSKFSNQYPKQFCDVGIAEEYAVTYAAGMAKGGLKPIVTVYSTFLQRAYDQILHDVCIQNLPVVFCLDRAGLVGEDGKTHQGTFDLSYLLHMPNMTVLAPTTANELCDAMDYALSLNSPVAIRYPKSFTESERITSSFDVGFDKIKEGDEVSILAVGPRMVDVALEFANSSNKSVEVISARVVKPLDTNTLLKIKDKKIITMEENSIVGGFGSLVNGFYSEKNIRVDITNLGVKDWFVDTGSVNEQLVQNGLTVEKLQDITK